MSTQANNVGVYEGRRTLKTTEEDIKGVRDRDTKNYSSVDQSEPWIPYPFKNHNLFTIKYQDHLIYLHQLLNFNNNFLGSFDNYDSIYTIWNCHGQFRGPNARLRGIGQPARTTPGLVQPHLINSSPVFDEVESIYLE